MYGTLMKKDLHTVLHADKKSSVYTVHVEFSFYTLFCKIFVSLCLQKVYLLIEFDPDCICIHFVQ